MFGLLALLAFVIGEKGTGELAGGQTMAFAVLSLSQVIQAYNMRSEHSLFKIESLPIKAKQSSTSFNWIGACCVVYSASHSVWNDFAFSTAVFRSAGTDFIPVVIMECSKAFGLIKHQH